MGDALDLDPIRHRLGWLRDNEKQCERYPGQVSMSGYLAAAVDCGKDVPQLLAEIERLTTSAGALEAVVQQAEEYVEERDQRNADLASDLLEVRAQRAELAKRCEGYEAAMAELGRQLDEERAESSNLRVALEAMEDDRNEYRHGVSVYAELANQHAGEVERLRKELAEMGAKP